MSQVVIYLFFIALIIFSFYYPGKVIIESFKIGKQPLEKHVLSWVTGVTTFLLLSYGLAFFNLTPLLYLILAGFFLAYIYYKNHTIKKPLPKIDYWTTSILIIGSLSFLSMMYFSGYQTEKGMQFIGVNSGDGIVHTAYIKSQASVFPPQHPSLAEIPLRGYHFFMIFS